MKIKKVVLARPQGPRAIKSELGVLTQGCKILEHGDSYQLREEPGTYIAYFDEKNGDIGGENSYVWDLNV